MARLVHMGGAQRANATKAYGKGRSGIPKAYVVGMSTGVCPPIGRNTPEPVGLERAALLEHAARRLREDPQVPPQRPGRDVHGVEVPQVVVCQLAAAADLPQSGDARRDVEAAR